MAIGPESQVLLGECKWGAATHQDLSLILRHKPEQFAVLLDPEGFASVQDIVRAMRESMPDVCIDDVRRVVEIDALRASESGVAF